MDSDLPSMDISVQCPNSDCRHHFAVDAKFQGAQVPCPACGTLTEVPWSLSLEDDPLLAAIPIHTAEEPELLVSDTVNCPSCYNEIQADDAVCLSCGYNRKTGKRLTTVRERKAQAVIRPEGAGAGGLVLCLVGGFFIFLAILCLGTGHWLLAIPFVLPGLGFLPLGFFFAQTTRATLYVSLGRNNRIRISIVYESFAVPIFRRELQLSPDDRLIICHDVPPLALVTLLALLCVGVIPGILWWVLLLSKRTNLEIRTAMGKRVERFSLFWGEHGTRELIDVIREVEPLTIERA